MEGSNFKTLTELSAAGKRTADQITPEPVANHYEDANAMLRELHELRKRRPTETTNPDPVMLEKENRIVTLGEIKSGSNLKTTNSLDALSNTIKLPLEESKSTNENKLSDKKWLYINKLMYYPKDDYRDCMIGFREMLYEDLLKGITLSNSLSSPYLNSNCRSQKRKVDTRSCVHDDIWI